MNVNNVALHLAYASPDTGRITTAQKRCVRLAGLVVACALGVLVPPTGSPAVGAATNGVVSSTEVYTTSTGCSNRAALRAQADLLDASWRSDVAADSYEIGTIGSGAALNPAPNPTPISFAGTSTVVNVSKHDVVPADVTSTASGTWGTVDVSNSSDPALTTSATLQDCGPRPARLYDSSAANRPVLWNATGGSGSTLDAVLFEFSVPVAGFGAWFADVETSEAGSVAHVKLFDDTDAVIAVVPLLADRTTPLADDPSGRSTCGGLQPTDALACGNQATRFIGFSFDTPRVAKMLVIVGDDDACSEFPSDCDGTSEHISFIGPQLALFDDPVVTTTTTSTTLPPSSTTLPASSTTLPTTTAPMTTASTTASTASSSTLAPSTTTDSTEATTTQAPSTSLSAVVAATIQTQPAASVLPVTGRDSPSTVGLGLALLLVGHLLWFIGARARPSTP